MAAKTQKTQNATRSAHVTVSRLVNLTVSCISLSCCCPSCSFRLCFYSCSCSYSSWPCSCSSGSSYSRSCSCFCSCSKVIVRTPTRPSTLPGHQRGRWCRYTIRYLRVVLWWYRCVLRLRSAIVVAVQRSRAPFSSPRLHRTIVRVFLFVLAKQHVSFTETVVRTLFGTNEPLTLPTSLWHGQIVFRKTV